MGIIRVQRHRLTYALFVIAALLAIGLTASPAVRVQYYLWQLERHEAAVSRTTLNPLPTNQQITDSFAYVDYYQERLVSLGCYFRSEYELDRLKDNYSAFSRLHQDFAKTNRSRTATVCSYAPHGTLVIHDLVENKPIWDKFVAEHDTAEFAEGQQNNPDLSK